MKAQLLVSILVAWFCTSPLMAFEMDAEMQKYLNEATVLEDGIPSGITDPSRFPFALYLQSNWKSLLDSIETIAPTRRQQAVLFVSAEFMPSDEYLDFVKTVLRKCETGSVPKETVRNRVATQGAKRFGFLEFNYRHPKVRDICQTIKRLFPGEIELQNHMDAILSGAAAKQAASWLSQNGRPVPEVLPIKEPPQTPAVALPDATSTPSPPVATVTPLPSAPVEKVAETPAVTAERTASVWPWLVGIAALTVIAWLVLKRRT